MNIQRAQEILQSEQTIPVFFNDQSIWIEEVYPISRHVLLHPVEQPDQQQIVSAEELREQH